MIFNHERRAVWQHEAELPSTCPSCGATLLAKRGDRVVWHWAHRPKTAGRECAEHKESRWHLAMKAAYLGFRGWEVEKPARVGGKSVIVDAFNPHTFAVREFVHSLSPAYVDKHRRLVASGADVLWIYDGDEFVSARATSGKGGSMRKLLKPVASDIHADTGGLVLWRDTMWRHWAHGVWFPSEGRATREIVRRFRFFMDNPKYIQVAANMEI